MDETILNEDSWWSLQWFSPDVLLNFHWEYGPILYLIPVLPFLFFLRWLFHFRFRQKLDIAFPASELRKWQLESLLRFLPPVFFFIFMALIILALARPQKTSEKVESFTQGIDIILALDISESMLLEDFYPNRLEVSKKIIRDFVEKRKQDRIGVVVFSGAALTLVPLTTDEELLRQSIDEIDPSILDTGATAIGNAIGVSINRLNEAGSASKVLVLLTDGENTTGNIGPETAAKLAYAFGIRIYCIGVGKEGSVPFGKDEQGRTIFVTSSINENSLKKIAAIGKGEYFRAHDEKALQNIFSKINQYEKGRIREVRFKDNKDYYRVYLTWAIVLLILWMLTKSTFLSNALED